MVIAARLLLGVFHLGEQGVPPGGTERSTWGNINHGFLHGSTMEESESTARTSTSPLWGLVAAAQGSGGRGGSHEFEERHGGLRPWAR
jgi:hypothetical protein